MPALANYYLEECGRQIRVPRVTDLLKQFGWSLNGLMYWANQCGLQGMTLDDARKPAADVGTIAHECIKADAHGEPMPDLTRLPDEMRGQVERALEAWERWRSRVRFKILAAEQRLVSKTWRYGGTLDAAIVDDSVGLIDYKTAKGCYPDNVVQLAAYGTLWNEHHPEQPIADYHLIRLSKDDASFHHHSWPASAMEDAWKAFRCALVLARVKRKIEGQL